MKIFAASTCVLTLLLFVSFFVHSQSVSSDLSLTQKAQPTPPVKEPTEPTATPTPICSPKTSISKEQKEYPFRELDLEDAIDLGLGTSDWDCDGIFNVKDNCIFAYNPNQKDSNGDGKGDVCDPELVDASFRDSRCDQDQDGIPDFRDNCLLACNPDQKDTNKNGIGDVCDQVFPNAVLTLQSCEIPKKVKVPKSIKKN